MSYFTHTLDGDVLHANLKAAALSQPPKLNPLASCFKPRASRMKAEATVHQSSQENNAGTRAANKTVTFYTPNPGETSGLVAYVNQRFCSVSRRDAQLLELLAPGPPLPARLQPACAYCHKRSPKICWHPFKDNLGRIICPLIGYKLAVLETYRKKHPSYQAIKSLHRRVLANQRRSSTSGQFLQDEQFKMPLHGAQNLFQTHSSEEDAKLKRRYLKYEAERQSHEADYLQKLQECEKAYNNKSTGEVLSYMPVSERIASRSLRCSSKLTSSKASSVTRLDTKNRQSKILKSTKGILGCSTNSPLGEEVLSVYSDANYDESEKFPSNMNAFVERVLAHDDSCLSHITGSSNFSGSSSSPKGNTSDSSGLVRSLSFDWQSFATDRSSENFVRHADFPRSILQSDRNKSSLEGSFIFSIAEKLEKAEEINFYSRSPSFNHVLDGFQLHLENLIRNEEISFSCYGRLMGSLLERCAMRRASLNKYLTNDFFNVSDYQSDLISLALGISRLLPDSKFTLRRRTYWKDLEYIYFTATAAEGKINEETRINLLNEVEDIVSSSISNISASSRSSAPPRSQLVGHGSLGLSSDSQPSSYESDPSSCSDVSENDTNPVFEPSESQNNDANYLEFWQSNFRVDFPLDSIPVTSISKSAWTNFPDSKEESLDNENTSNFYGPAGESTRFQRSMHFPEFLTEPASTYYGNEDPEIKSPELHPEPYRSCLDFKTALSNLKLLDYFLDNYVTFINFLTDDAIRNMGQESARRESLEKAIEKLDKMVDKGKDGVKSKVEWLKPNFEKVNEINAVWSSYKMQENYSLW